MTDQPGYIILIHASHECKKQNLSERKCIISTPFLVAHSRPAQPFTAAPGTLTQSWHALCRCSPQLLKTAWVFFEAKTRRTRAVGASAVWTHYLLRLNHVGVNNFLTRALLATKATLHGMSVEAKRMNVVCVAEFVARAHMIKKVGF